MAWKNITGLWRNKFGNYQFKMTLELKQKINEIPEGTYITVFPAQEKRTEKHPDANLSWNDEGRPNTYQDNIPF